MKFLSFIFFIVTISNLWGTEIIIDASNKTGKMTFVQNFQQDYIRVDSINILETDAELDKSKTPLPFYLTPRRTEIIYFKFLSLEEIHDILDYEIYQEEELMIKGTVKVKTAEPKGGAIVSSFPIQITIPILAGFILTLIVIIIFVTSMSNLKKKLTNYTSGTSSPDTTEMQKWFESKLLTLTNQLGKSNENILGGLKKLEGNLENLPQSIARRLSEILDEREIKKYLEEMGRKRNSIQHKFDNRFKEIQNQPTFTLCRLISDISEKRVLDMSLLPAYLQIGKKWARLMIEWNQFLQEPEVRKVEHLSDEQYWARKIEEIITELNSLPKEPPISSSLPLLEQIWKDSTIQIEKEKILELLKLEEIMPTHDKLLDEVALKDYEIVKTEGTGRHLYVKEVVAPGYRRRDNKIWIKKPKIKVEAK